MRTEIAEPLNYCMYCGDTSADRFTDEHVIAECFNGHLVLPRSTCDACSNATAAIEREIARGTLWEARAKLKLRRKKKSNRSNDYPADYPVDLLLVAEGTSFTVRVPIDSAPIIVLVPHYIPYREQDCVLESTCQLKATPLSADHDNAVASILRQYSAHSATFETKGIRVGIFERLLWKSCYGFLWSICSDSVRSAGLSGIVRGTQSPFSAHDPNDNAALLAVNIQSFERERTDSFEATTTIFSDASDGDRNIFCDLSFLAPFGLPVYRCQIPNVHRKSIPRSEFKAGQNGWSERSKKAAKISI